VPQIAICCRLYAGELRERLEAHLEALKGAGAGVEIRESAMGGCAFFTCALNAPAEPRAAGALEELFRARVAQAIAETVVCEFASGMIAGRLRRLRPDYTDADIEGALAPAERALGRLRGEERLFLVATEALECLWERERIDVDGFVRFRLREYKRRLDDCLHDAVRRYELGREQQEFIKLLRYLIEHQEASIDELHIFPGREDSFEMRDRNGSSVDSEYLEAYVWDLAREGCVDREDLLISALVSLAPLKVHWHFDRSVWRSQVAEKVLGRRLVYCSGCERCARQRT